MTSSVSLGFDQSDQRQTLLSSKVESVGKGKPYRGLLRQSRASFARTLVIAVALSCFACGQSPRRSGVPAGAQVVIDRSIEDIDAGRYEKLYQEAADEWRNESTLEDSKATFQKMRDKLGGVRTRSLQNAREEQTSTAPVRGHSVVVVYQTSFERGEGMETFTLLERGGQWHLARYFVSSNALR